MKADKLWAIRAHQQHGTVAAVESAPAEPAAIAAVKGGFSKPRGGGSGRGRGASGSSKLPAALNPAASPFVPLPTSLSRMQSGLCFYHWNFGDKASKCDGLCSWAGN